MPAGISDSHSNKRKRPAYEPPPPAPIPSPNLPRVIWNFYNGVTKKFKPDPHLNSPPSGDGQMANAEAGPSHDQNSHDVGEYAASTPMDMDFSEQMTNAEAGPSHDQSSHSLGDFTAPMQPLTTNGGISLHDNSGNHQPEGYAEQPPSTLAESVEISFNAEPGSAHSEEDNSYYDFRDGLDNPLAVQRVAGMVDEMTDLDVATKLAKHGKYETVNDLIHALNNGQTLGIKASDAKKTNGALKKLVRTLEHSNIKVKVRATSYFHRQYLMTIFGRLSRSLKY